jgi:hypothetical protein
MYAEGTTVSVEKSRVEVEKILSRYGATQRGVMLAESMAQIAFVVEGAKYRIDVPLPHRDPDKPPPGWHAWEEARRERYRESHHEQACRERWRAIVLMLKAKLEVISLGLSTVEREFMADMVLPNGRTASQCLPDIIRAGLADPGVRQLGGGTP